MSDTNNNNNDFFFYFILATSIAMLIAGSFMVYIKGMNPALTEQTES